MYHFITYFTIINTYAEFKTLNYISIYENTIVVCYGNMKPQILDSFRSYVGYSTSIYGGNFIMLTALKISPK